MELVTIYKVVMWENRCSSQDYLISKLLLLCMLASVSSALAPVCQCFMGIVFSFLSLGLQGPEVCEAFPRDEGVPSWSARLVRHSSDR